ncbi:MAG: hypothetical protein R6X13_09955 [bacterium]
MEIDGLDWLDWLHKTRRELEEKRVREGLSVEEWLRRLREGDDKRRAERRAQSRAPLARDK